MEKKTRARRAPLVALILLAVAGVALSAFFRPMPNLAEPSLLQSDAAVRIERDARGLAFLPLGSPRSPGLVFYPGARVPPEAYAYLGKPLAAAGFPVVIAALPLNFAVFSPKAAAKIAAARPEIAPWVVGGHSLGGAMAASWASTAAQPPAGILLLAAYPGGGTDLSRTNLPLLSLAASNDGLAAPATMEAHRSLLPAGSRVVEIAGGNHAQFGEYGPQPGDGAADLPAAAQRRAVVAESLMFMESLAAR